MNVKYMAVFGHDETINTEFPPAIVPVGSSWNRHTSKSEAVEEERVSTPSEPGG